MFCEIDKSESMTIIPAGPVKSLCDRETGQSPGESAFNDLLSSRMDGLEIGQQELGADETSVRQQAEEARRSKQERETADPVTRKDDDRKDIQRQSRDEAQEIDNNSDASCHSGREDDIDAANDSGSWAGDQASGAKEKSQTTESSQIKGRRPGSNAHEKPAIKSVGNKLTNQTLSAEQEDKKGNATGQSAEMSDVAKSPQSPIVVGAGEGKRQPASEGEKVTGDVNDGWQSVIAGDQPAENAKNQSRKQFSVANGSAALNQSKSTQPASELVGSEAGSDASQLAGINKLAQSWDKSEPHRQTSKKIAADAGTELDTKLSHAQAVLDESQPGTKLPADGFDAKLLAPVPQYMVEETKTADSSGMDGQSVANLSSEKLSRRSEAADQPLPGGESAAAKTGRNAADEAAVNVQRIVHALRLAHERNGEIRLRLHPPELGALRLEMRVEHGALTARLEVESSAARDVLLENLPQLRERLAEHRIRVDQFDVSLPRDGSQGNPHNQQTGSDASQRPRTTPGVASPQTEPASVNEPQKWRVGSTSQFDVII